MRTCARSSMNGWRRILSAGVAFVLCVMPVSAQPPSVTPNQRIGFDYLDADRAQYQVTRFEISIDGGSWTQTATQENVFPDTLAGATTHSVAPALTPGNHTISFRACNVAGCSGGTSPFAFTYSIVPPGGTNVRIVGG